MIVLDASAILAVIHQEPGAEQVVRVLSGAWLSAVNFAEVVGKLGDAQKDPQVLRDLLTEVGVWLEPLGVLDAELAGALRGIEGGKTLSLGDRCCLALGLRLQARVLTADRLWAALDLPVEVTLIR
ncbi:MAG: type II toxin-antitoxin system VapC family toxin [Angustibacter sp.]